MKILKLVFILIVIFITASIWYPLLYLMFGETQATELTQFLCWVCIPIGLFVLIIVAIIRFYKNENKKEKI